MKLEILGSGCANCKKLMAVTEAAVRDLGIDDAELVKVEDFPKIMAYGVMSTPALVIDGTGRAERQSAVAGRGRLADHHGAGVEGMREARRGATGALLAVAVTLAALLVLAGCGGTAGDAGSSTATSAAQSSGTAPKVTFLELGANSCVPCKEMKPVMKGIEQAFGDQVEVIFYDVWDDPAPANEYGIQMIPTQIFLDENGEEFHRHTGFYPQADIEALLVEQGLTKLTTQ